MTIDCTARKNRFAKRKTETEHAFRDALLDELKAFFEKKMLSCPEFFSLETPTEAAYRQRICREEYVDFSLSTAFKTAERYRYKFRFLIEHQKLVA